MAILFKLVRVTGLLFLLPLCLWAQKPPEHDSTYYESYPTKITARYYFSEKFTSLRVRDTKYNLNYRPNTHLNMGVGATLGGATLNLAYGFKFLNPDNGHGKTHYLDLQFHNYGQKVIVDFFGQFYRGFYLDPKGNAAPSGDQYYLRPDLKVNQIGGSVQYVLNHDKFSYRAAFLQNEWQKKTAGTWIIGFEIYTGRIRADSSIIPTVKSGIKSDPRRDRVRYFEVGPNGGYAYTYVFDEHYFVTASGSLSLDFGTTSLDDGTTKENKQGISPNTFLRFVVGYNSSRWGWNFLYINNSVRLANNVNRDIILNTGNFRLNLNYRFSLSPKALSFLKRVKQKAKEKI